jgi:hypothetical protein
LSPSIWSANRPKAVAKNEKLSFAGWKSRFPA